MKPSNFKFSIGDKVQKVKGYKWPSIIVSNFTNSKGENRIVCECIGEGAEGALHIFNEEQMELIEGLKLEPHSPARDMYEAPKQPSKLQSRGFPKKEKTPLIDKTNPPRRFICGNQ